MVVIQNVDGAGWRRVEIPERGLSLRLGDSGVELAAGLDAEAATCLLVDEVDGAQRAVLVTRDPRRLFVDGRTPLPVWVLDERAEILLAGERLYVSGHQPFVVAVSADDAICPVCNDPTEGAECITCPRCGAVAHEGVLSGGGERRCFGHVGRCSGCGLRPADVDWTPDGDRDAR